MAIISIFGKNNLYLYVLRRSDQFWLLCNGRRLPAIAGGALQELF
jgi:hypothetical protein